MYYPEDQYHPNNNDDEGYFSENIDDMGDNNTYYTNDSYSIVSNNRKQKKSFDLLKTMDKGYHKLKIEKDGKNIAVEVYTTGYTPGTTIRDAVTGSYYRGLNVGSKHEDQFFKVKILNKEMGREAGNLFFFTPDEFERHYKTTLKQSLKDKWEERFSAYQKKYGKERE
jgi:hypothetical protein